VHTLGLIPAGPSCGTMASASASTDAPKSDSVPLRIVSWNVNGLRAVQRALCAQICAGDCAGALRNHEAQVARADDAKKGEGESNKTDKFPQSEVLPGKTAPRWEPHPLRAQRGAADGTINERTRPNCCAALRICFEARFDADVVCLQETKLPSAFKDIPEELCDLGDGWESFFSMCKARQGYSGCVTFARKGLVHDVPAHRRCGGINSTRGTLSTGEDGGFDDLDEGRCVVTDIGGGALTLFNLYVPNGGRGEHKVEFKLQFCKEVQRQCMVIRKQDDLNPRPHVMFVGDLNTCHRDVDIHNPEASRENPRR
jgi:exonuclease III